MKNHLSKKISIVLAVFFLLAALPMTAMAQKELDPLKKLATPSNLEETLEEETTAAEEETTAAEEETTAAEEETTAAEETTAEVTETTEAETTAEIVETTAAETTAAETTAAVSVQPTPVKKTAADLIGSWKADEVTTYRFSKGGKGSLVLPKKSYAFSYGISEDELTLTFENSRVGKKVFSFAVEGDELTLQRTGAQEFAPVVLEKAAD